jgi:hypothetical protein
MFIKATLYVGVGIALFQAGLRHLTGINLSKEDPAVVDSDIAQLLHDIVTGT